MLLDIRCVPLFLDILFLVGSKTNDGRYRNGYINMVDNCGCEISLQDIMPIILMLFLEREQGKRCFMLPPEGTLQISKSLSPQVTPPFPLNRSLLNLSSLSFIALVLVYGFYSTFSSV